MFPSWGCCYVPQHWASRTVPHNSLCPGLFLVSNHGHLCTGEIPTSYCLSGHLIGLSSSPTAPPLHSHCIRKNRVGCGGKKGTSRWVGVKMAEYLRWAKASADWQSRVYSSSQCSDGPSEVSWLSFAEGGFAGAPIRTGQAVLTLNPSSSPQSVQEGQSQWKGELWLLCPCPRFQTPVFSQVPHSILYQ